MNLLRPVCSATPTEAGAGFSIDSTFGDTNNAVLVHYTVNLRKNASFRSSEPSERSSQANQFETRQARRNYIRNNFSWVMMARGPYILYQIVPNTNSDIIKLDLFLKGPVLAQRDGSIEPSGI